jgi:hypothetical protein
VLREPAAALVPGPGEVVGDTPAAGALPVEAQLGEDVEPAGHGVGVAEESARLELRFADERLRVDDEPRLAFRAEDVAAVQVLVHESGRRAVDRAVGVERTIEQSALEGLSRLAVPPRQVLRPAVRLVAEERERVFVADLDLKARQQLGDHRRLIDVGVP